MESYNININSSMAFPLMGRYSHWEIPMNNFQVSHLISPPTILRGGPPVNESVQLVNICEHNSHTVYSKYNYSIQGGY